MNVGWILYCSEIRENWTLCFRFLHLHKFISNSSQKWHKLIQSGTKFTLLLKLLLWNVSGVTRRQIGLVVYNLNELICNYSLCLPFFSKVKNVVFLPAGNFSSTIQQRLILQTFFSLLNQSQHTCHITADRILKCQTNYFSMMPTFVSASPSVTGLFFAEDNRRRGKEQITGSTRNTNGWWILSLWYWYFGSLEHIATLVIQKPISTKPTGPDSHCC